MLFNSFEFIFVFLPIVLIVYFLLNNFKHYTSAKVFLIFSSLYFYAYFTISYLPIIISSIIFNYIIGSLLNGSGEILNNKFIITKRKLWLFLGVIFNVGLLGYFKYMDFFIENYNLVFNSNFQLLHILLPLGISFFTFHQLAFIVDSYYHKRIHPSFLDYCNFVTFFPQLIAGPIVLPSEMLPQFEDLKNKAINYENMNKGLMLFSLGLVKKVFIADSIAGFANTGFDVVDSLTLAEGWLTSLSFTLQLYFDFSGYCDMAMGIALMFNIVLPLNFNAPYKSADFQDFWRRWHMTLGRFMTQYLYIPLGGNRQGELRTLINLMIVFLVSGIWHGAGWTFILWGFLHGAGILIHRIWKNKNKQLNHFAGILITFFFVNIFWVFFRANTVESGIKVLKGMFTNLNISLTEQFTSQLPSLFQNRYNMLILILALILVMFGKTAYELVESPKNQLYKKILTVFCFLLGVILINRIVPFLYFNF